MKPHYSCKKLENNMNCNGQTMRNGHFRRQQQKNTKFGLEPYEHKYETK